MQGIIPDSTTSALESVVPNSDSGYNFASTLSQAKGLLIGLGILTFALKVMALISSCFGCFLVQYLLKVVFVFVSFSWSLHDTMAGLRQQPTMSLCSLYSIMPTFIFMIALVGTQFALVFIALPSLITEILTLLVASGILVVVLRYSTQELHSRLQEGTYNNSLWNFYR